MNPDNRTEITARGGYKQPGGANMTGLDLVIGNHRLSLAIDAGASFPDLTQKALGVAKLLPNFKYLEKVDSIVITHGHYDHTGGLVWLARQSPNIRVFAPPYAAALIQANFEDQKLKVPSITSLADGQEIVWRLADGEVVAYYVNVSHSIPDSKAVVIKSPLGTIIHTGDWRGTEDAWGHKTNWAELERLGDEGVLALLIDATSASRRSSWVTEAKVEQTISRIVDRASGRIWATFFASNIGRAQLIINAAIAAGRYLVYPPLGWSLRRNTELAIALQYLKIDQQHLVTLDQAQRIPPGKLLYLVAGSQAEEGSALVALVEGTLTRQIDGAPKTLRLETGDTLIISASIIPGPGERRIPEILAELFRRRVYVYSQLLGWDVHASGHPSGSGELREMIQCTRPKWVIPVQAGLPDLTNVAQMARLSGYHAWVMHSQQGVAISPNGDLTNLGLIQGENLYLDAQEREIPPEILTERREMAEQGVILVTLPLSPDGQIQTIGVTLIGVGEGLGFQLSELEEAALKDLRGKRLVTVTEAKEIVTQAIENVLQECNLWPVIRVETVHLNK